MSETSKIRIPSVDVAALGRRGNQQRLEAHVGLGHLDELVSTEVVQISDEPLELGHDAQEVRVGDGPPDLQRAAAAAVDVSEVGVRLRKDIDRSPPVAVPALQW